MSNSFVFSIADEIKKDLEGKTNLKDEDALKKRINTFQSKTSFEALNNIKVDLKNKEIPSSFKTKLYEMIKNEKYKILMIFNTKIKNQYHEIHFQGKNFKFSGLSKLFIRYLQFS